MSIRSDSHDRNISQRFVLSGPSVFTLLDLAIQMLMSEAVALLNLLELKDQLRGRMHKPQWCIVCIHGRRSSQICC